MSYNVIDHVYGKKLDIRCGDARIVVDRVKAAVYQPPQGDIRAAASNGVVRLLIAGRAIEMTTPVATKVGFALSKNGGACMYLGDVVSFTINGDEIHLLPAVAVQLGGGLMLKADRADDWQRANPKRRLQ